MTDEERTRKSMEFQDLFAKLNSSGSWVNYWETKDKAAEEAAKTAGQVPEVPVVVRRGIEERFDDAWNHPDWRVRVPVKVATFATIGVVGVEAGMVIGNALADGGEGIRRGIETFVYNGTCAGSNKETCGIVTAENVGARLIGAGVDWLSMPKRVYDETRGLGIPSGEAFWKTVALVIEEIKVGAVRKTVGRAAVAGLRTLPTIAGALRTPKIETKG